MHCEVSKLTIGQIQIINTPHHSTATWDWIFVHFPEIRECVLRSRFDVYVTQCNMSWSIVIVLATVFNEPWIFSPLSVELNARTRAAVTRGSFAERSLNGAEKLSRLNPSRTVLCAGSSMCKLLPRCFPPTSTFPWLSWPTVTPCIQCPWWTLSQVLKTNSSLEKVPKVKQKRDKECFWGFGATEATYFHRSETR